MLELDYTRRCERRDVDILCDVVARNWDEPIPYRISDLSPRGMWLSSSFPLEVGEVAVVTLRAEGDGTEPLELFARVVRSIRARRVGVPGRSGMGIEFVGMGNDERAKLRRRVQGLAPVRRPGRGLPLPLS
ncbi:MAG: hypothetical protein EXR75_08060 [Myxococcales bacterium]|nr:hypothetical protein [Myxococcales bacterium]